MSAIPGPGEAIDFPRRNYGATNGNYILYKIGARLAVYALFVGGTAGLGITSEIVRDARNDQAPYFRSFEWDGCTVSNDAKWAVPRDSTGIDDLVIRNVEGVTAEYGPGSQCLEAAKQVIIIWSKNDGITFNDIHFGPNDPKKALPIIQARAPYRVPVEVTPN